ncbi:MAG: type I methionyl aminopeptidase [Peptoniphilaceae bacterium]|nr:type I methionyl aminopeptidase [Peptoniphilaceae bacterium]MDY5765794.1 type I methionyl aminopeptidase [Peptoniphilaceae bacterium]
MITIKTDEQIAGMKRAGEILSKTHLAIRSILRPGMTTLQVNDFADAFMRYKNAIPAQLGYEGFPFALCTSVNDEVCHGYPNDRALQEGDILSIDNVVSYEGYLADSCWSYAIGTLSEEDQRLFDVTREAMYRGIQAAKAGNHLVDIGRAIQPFVEENGFSVVRAFVGHGIGREMHEDPQVLHYVTGHRGVRLRENMVITVEPMVNAGTWEVKVDEENGWVATTADGKKSCQFEHTFAIRKEGPEILTEQKNASLTQEEREWIAGYRW